MSYRMPQIDFSYSAWGFMNIPWPTSNGTLVAYFVLFLVAAYSVLHHSDKYPTLSIKELLWNLLVYATPPSLVLALDKKGSTSTAGEQVDASIYVNSRTFAAKSEAMRRILGIEGEGGVMSTIQRSRSMSGVGSIFKSVPSKALPGLGNWDNSCYQNSILQGLASIPSLYEFLRQAHTASACDDSLSANLALKSLIEELNHGKNSGLRIWTPPALKNMSSWQQQDAQEYYSKVVDEMEKEIAKVLNSGPMKAEPGRRNAGLGALVDRHQLPDQISTFLRNPLEGLLAQRVGCLKCGFVEGLSLIPFNCLTVPLGRYHSYDMREGLDEYTTLEPISGVECANCTLLMKRGQLSSLLAAKKSRTEEGGEDQYSLSGPVREATLARLEAVEAAISSSDFSESTLAKKCMIPSKNRVSTTKSRQAVIARAPEALVVHVNRSVFDERTGMLSKNYAEVRFQKTLDLSPWCLGSMSEEGAVETWNTDPSKSMLADDDESQPGRTSTSTNAHNIYNLRAIVTHYGRHENGHYIAYRQSPSHAASDSQLGGSAQWWRLSDEDVSKVSEENVLAQGGVFMLFYERASDPVTSSIVPDATSMKYQLELPLGIEDSALGLEETTSLVALAEGSEHPDESRAVNSPLATSDGHGAGSSQLAPQTQPAIDSSNVDSTAADTDRLTMFDDPLTTEINPGDSELPVDQSGSKASQTDTAPQRPPQASTQTTEDLRAVPEMRTSSAAASGKENMSQIGQVVGLVQAN